MSPKSHTLFHPIASEASSAKQGVDLDIDNPGRLRESALLKLPLIRKMHSYQLPKNPEAWWQKLGSALNGAESINGLSKEAIDEED